jgi:hypothetical protein
MLRSEVGKKRIVRLARIFQYLSRCTVSVYASFCTIPTTTCACFLARVAKLLKAWCQELATQLLAFSLTPGEEHRVCTNN